MAEKINRSGERLYLSKLPLSLALKLRLVLKPAPAAASS
jgi:hypothetical protein